MAHTKLSRSAKPGHVLQLCVHASMLEGEQGVAPPRAHIVLGDGRVASFQTSRVRHYLEIARERFEAFVTHPPDRLSNDPCRHCAVCRWQEQCAAEWKAGDHLSLVAGLGRNQVDTLRAAGVPTLVELASLAPSARVPGMQPAAVERMIDVVTERLAAHPNAHIYHYAG